MSHFALICQKRNAELPVSRLPTEIICSVLHALQDLEPIVYLDPSNYPAILAGELPARLGWMKALHVMHFWRNAALGDPTLWTTITSSLSRAAFEETLRRRRGTELPLHVDLSSSSRGLRWDNVSASDYIIHRTGIQNIASLQVVGASLPLLQPHVHMPRLHSLRVHLSSEGPSTLPRQLPLIEAPALRELYLHNVIPREHSGTLTRPLDIAPLFGLTSLTLSLSPDEIDWRPSIVTSILCQTTRLEYLKLSGYVIVVSDDDTDPNVGDYESLHLDRLIHFELDTSFIGAAYLLWRIRMNPEARLLLTVDVRRRSETVHIEQAYRLMRERHLHSQFPPLSRLRTLRLHGSETDVNSTAFLSAWRDDAPQCLLPDFDVGDTEDHPPDFQLKFMCGRQSLGSTLSLETLLAVIPLNNIRNISLHSLATYGFYMSSWSPVFDRLSESPLRWLCLDGYYALSLIENPDMRKGDVLPHLQALALFGIPWKPHPGRPNRVQELAELLEARAASSIPITQLFVEENHDHVETLIDAVGRDVVHALEFLDEDSARAFQIRCWEI